MVHFTFIVFVLRALQTQHTIELAILQTGCTVQQLDIGEALIRVLVDIVGLLLLLGINYARAASFGRQDRSSWLRIFSSCCLDSVLRLLPGLQLECVVEVTVGYHLFALTTSHEILQHGSLQ